MCWPHPAQVGFPQVWQFTRWHMLAVLLFVDTGIGARARSNRCLSEMQGRLKT